MYQFFKLFYTVFMFFGLFSFSLAVWWVLSFLKLLNCVFGSFRLFPELFQFVAVVQVVLDCFCCLKFSRVELVLSTFLFEAV